MNITLHDPQNKVTVFDRVPNALSAMNLMDKVKRVLEGEQNLWAMGIKYSTKPYIETLAMIKDNATDNYSAVAKQLGEHLTNEILNF